MKTLNYSSPLLTIQFGAHNSHWPLLMSMSLTSFLLSIIYFVNFVVSSLLMLTMIFLGFSLTLWMKDISREFLLKGWGSQMMIKIIKSGFVVFIFSEIMFFFSFFWTYFHFLLMVSPESVSFPGVNLPFPEYEFLAFLNTMLLLSSGFSLTSSHLSLILMKDKKFLKTLSVTLFLGLLFLSCQLLEYKQLGFLMADSCYSSVFYLTTSFHGSHVLVGWVMLFLLYFKNFPTLYLFFEVASWYWHFVDVVWLFLFSFFYWTVSMG